MAAAGVRPDAAADFDFGSRVGPGRGSVRTDADDMPIITGPASSPPMQPIDLSQTSSEEPAAPRRAAPTSASVALSLPQRGSLLMTTSQQRHRWARQRLRRRVDQR